MNVGKTKLIDFVKVNTAKLVDSNMKPIIKICRCTFRTLNDDSFNSNLLPTAVQCRLLLRAL